MTRSRAVLRAAEIDRAGVAAHFPPVTDSDNLQPMPSPDPDHAVSLYVPLVAAPAARKEPAFWFAFQRTEIIVVNGAASPELPCCRDLAEHGLVPEQSHYLGLYRGRHCYAVAVPETGTLPAGWSRLGLRDLFGMVETTLAALSGRAWQLIEWDRDHRYCGRCGTPTVPRADERARTCPACRMTSYPPVSPAIMILVTDGRRLLLARKKAFPAGRFSALAGFVEPGETLEDTIARETREEVGVEVKNVRYFGSQPWPFPHSLMIAFTADYAGGEIRPDGVEIEEARWFDPERLPGLPGSISISRRLIDTVAARLRAGRNPAGDG
ncbi:MAG: NAD(+) diphosphatase [Burkholderiales bacterium]|nr:NAD(+) diphosphatase [Burkholderiales bacterium]